MQIIRVQPPYGNARSSMNQKSDSRNNLVEGSIRQSLIRMTLPMIVGMFMLFTFSLVDTWFISFLGTDSLTAISFTFPVTFTVTSLAIGLGIGAAAVVLDRLLFGFQQLVEPLLGGILPRSSLPFVILVLCVLAFAVTVVAPWFERFLDHRERVTRAREPEDAAAIAKTRS